MTWRIRATGYDADALAYFARVEGASGDNQVLETPVKDAINSFIVGCKSDGVWNAIKASCILAGARTLDGALQPLVGTAPTNFNFVSGDYDRKTGLKGNGSTKYLNSNRSTIDDPVNDAHISAYVTTGSLSTGAKTLVGAYAVATSATYIGTDQGPSYQFFVRSEKVNTGNISDTGLIAAAKQVSNQIITRIAGISTTHGVSFNLNAERNYGVLGNLNQFYGDQRIAFYSIGESLDLELLDNRVSTLINHMAFYLNTGLDPNNYDIDTVRYINAGYAAGGTLT